MGHQLVALLGGSVEADRVVHLVVCRIRYFLVGSVYGRRRGIDQMLHFVVAACLKDVVESDEIALNIGIRIGDAVAHPGLGREIDYDSGAVVREKLLH